MIQVSKTVGRNPRYTISQLTAEQVAAIIDALDIAPADDLSWKLSKQIKHAVDVMHYPPLPPQAE